MRSARESSHDVIFTVADSSLAISSSSGPWTALRAKSVYHTSITIPFAFEHSVLLCASPHPGTSSRSSFAMNYGKTSTLSRE